MAEIRKKRNPFVAYFKPFGLRQICDLLMLAGFVLLIVGLCTTEVVLIVGFSIITAAALIAIIRCVLVLIDKEINHRAPSYKNARINVIIMSVFFALSLFGLIWAVI